MEFKNVGGHTFDESILKDGVIIDVGCRAFTFEDYFKDKKVYSIDPDPDVFKGREMKDTYLNVAISDNEGESGIYVNGEATCLKEIDPDQSHKFIPCKTISMADLYAITGTNVDLLKLDCEGAEYIILGETFKPVPKQISVEFHNHCVPNLHHKHYPSILERLSKDYDVYNESWEQRHGCGFNFWDTLFIRKW